MGDGQAAANLDQRRVSHFDRWKLSCDLTFGRCLAVVADWAVTGTQSAPGVIVRPAQRREINFLVSRGGR
ncbi:MAG TPA: hypothetical protein VEO01_03950, partial [Pseudonocardiaceae bacterium]|nr:hypothetical protein [Pseudonocardiaceae bacterium]